jgi:hypothetical protein
MPAPARTPSYQRAVCAAVCLCSNTIALHCIALECGAVDLLVKFYFLPAAAVVVAGIITSGHGSLSTLALV